MSDEVSNSMEFSAADLAGSAPGRVARRLFLATRPKFFPASVLPVLAGTAWGVHVAGEFDPLVFALALLATVCVHAGANVLNDVGDELGGSDRLNTSHIYPYTGGSRFIQNEIMSLREMAGWGVALIAAAVAIGAVLLWLEGPAILLFGLAGVALAAAYSLPPLMLSAHGWGETAVAVGFGVLPVSGAAWLQSGVVDFDVVLISLPVSLWVAAILLINEVPDMAADAAAGKRTLAVRLGETGSRRLYAGLQLGAFAALAAAVTAGLLPVRVLLLPAALAAVALAASRGISLRDRDRLRKAIEKTLAIHTLGTLWLALWAWPWPIG